MIYSNCVCKEKVRERQRQRLYNTDIFKQTYRRYARDPCVYCRRTRDVPKRQFGVGTSRDGAFSGSVDSSFLTFFEGSTARTDRLLKIYNCNAIKIKKK